MANLIGQRLGQYEVVALLGKGGMATVYRATQTSIERDVAIKVIKPDLAETKGFAERFQREAKTIASLGHPHILKVFDYGQQGEILYLVTELLKGGSLAEHIEQGAMPLPAVKELLNQIGSALDYAHKRGIIHRDLKPQNVLLDEIGSAYLTDFGIAKLIGATTSLTQSGASMGTPAYMPPEQWRGEPVDARADVYAMGVMLFEMLSGQLPFKADTPYSMMHKHVNDSLPSVRGLRPQLPSGIDAVLNKALAKDRDQRYSKASEVAEDFAAVIAPRQPKVNPNDPREIPTAVESGSEIKAALQTAKAEQKSPPTTPAAPRTEPRSTKPRNSAAATIREGVPSPAKQNQTPVKSLIPPSALDAPRSKRPVWQIIAGLAVIVAVIAVFVFMILPSLSTPPSKPDSTTAPSQIAVAPSAVEPSTIAPSATTLPVSAATTALTATTVAPTIAPTVPSIPATSVVVPPTIVPTVIPTLVATIVPTVAPTIVPTTEPAATTPGGTAIASANSLNIPGELPTYSGHTGWITSVAFSQDGQRIVTANRDRTAKIWNTASGSEQVTLQGHRGALLSAAFSPDGKIVVTTSEDKSARLWNAENGNEERTLFGHGGFIFAAAFSPDGKTLLTGSQDGTAKLWNVATGVEIRSYGPHTGWVIGVTFSPDGKTIATGSADGRIKLWDTQTRELLKTLTGHTTAIRSVAFSPDGQYLVSASADKTARIWDINAGGDLWTLSDHTDWVFSAVFSPNGKYVLTGSRDSTARLWDVATGQQLHVYAGHTSWVSSVAFSPDGNYVLTGSNDMTARLWPVITTP